MSHAEPSEQPDRQGGLTRRLPALYVLCALLVTLLLTLLTPPFFVPDEASHSLRALQIAHGQVIAQRSAQGAGGEVDPGAYAAMSRMMTIIAATAQRYPKATTRPDGRISRGDLAAVQALTWAHTGQFHPFANTAVYPPTLYLPQAAGWAIAEHLNLTVVHGLELARLCAALAAILTGWLALRYAVCSRAQLFALLLLPTCLSLNASTSQDAVLFGIAALAAACLGRPLRHRRQFHTGELILTTLLLTVCVAARVPCMPLLLVLFLPALDGAVLDRRSLLPPAVAAACGALLIGAWQMLVRPLGVLVGAGADLGRQQAFLHAHPVHAALVIGRSAVVGSSFTVLKGLAWLGTNDAAPPLAEYGLLVLAIGVIVLLSDGGCLHRWRARMLLLLAALGAAAAMSLAEYLIWTSPGASEVSGLQSRYYLPLLMLLALGLPARPIVRPGPRVRRFTLAASYVALLACVVTLPLLAAHRFYASGLIAALKEAAPRHSMR